MKAKSLISAAIVVASLFGGQLSAAQLKTLPLNQSAGQILLQLDPGLFQRVGVMPAAMVNKGCTFYEDNDGQGEAWHKAVGWLAQSYENQDSYAEYVTSVGPWWNDKISSLQCDETDTVKCSIGIYRDDNKGGGDEAILWSSQGMINLDRYGWNDAISSYMVFCNLLK
ncbi:MAG: hypothetical protein JWP26_2931 [Devosia sp.]|uniref:hypothetical protein n=1 Tax=Devosia sp. TaxID=1871048 RepID=UPI0026224ABE|nr:hypothetical protein [Devosia sp.]MDB5538106.1 hypothetical protein [Devosia sp.]MDB5587961.1 hypothetical protein [Devosia sp.]